LRRRRYFLVNGKMVGERRHFDWAHGAWVLLLMKQDEVPASELVTGDRAMAVESTLTDNR
jgi:hypothetical protein